MAAIYLIKRKHTFPQIEKCLSYHMYLMPIQPLLLQGNAYCSLTDNSRIPFSTNIFYEQFIAFWINTPVDKRWQNSLQSAHRPEHWLLGVSRRGKQSYQTPVQNHRPTHSLLPTPLCLSYPLQSTVFQTLQSQDVEEFNRLWS